MAQTTPISPSLSSVLTHATFNTLPLPPRTGAITALAWSEDNTHIAAVSSTGMLVIWHVESGACLLSQRITRASLCAVAWSRQGRSVLVGSTQGQLSVFHLASRTLVLSTTFSQPVAQIALSPNAIDTRFFVRTGSSLHLFTQGQAESRTLRYATSLVDACWSPDGQTLALVCANGLVEVCDTQSRRVIWRQTSRPSPALRVTWDATGGRLALGMANGTVQMQDVQCGHSSAFFPLSRFPIQALRWGERYVVAGSEHEVAFWNDTQETAYRQPTETLPAFTFDSHGAVLATAWPHALALTTLV